MERRAQPRCAAFDPVTVTILGERPETVPAVVENISARGMRLVLDKMLPVNSAVRVDFKGSLLLGEICYAESTGGRFAIGLSLDQVLHETPELARLNDALRAGSCTAQGRRNPPGSPAAGHDILSGECGEESPSLEAEVSLASSSCVSSARGAAKSAPTTGTS